MVENKKLRAIIVDDEILAIETLEEDIKRYTHGVEVVATCHESTLAKALIEKYKPDLIFLDIEMPVVNGFQLLQSFEKIDFEVVFITAYDKYALRAFEFSAADYLVKPVDRERLLNTIERIKLKNKSDKIEGKLSLILHNLKIGSKRFPTIAVPCKEGIEFIPVEEIIYMKSDSNYCNIYLINDKRLYVSKTLKHFIDLMGDFDFIRTHQSYYVNVRFIRKYTKLNGGEIILSNKKSIPISRHYKQNVMRYIQK